MTTTDGYGTSATPVKWGGEPYPIVDPQPVEIDRLHPSGLRSRLGL
jgi:hypothetical protein